jgi:hypothetical protein
MIRTTAEASNTRLAISAGTVPADQHLRRRVKGPLALLVCQSLKVGEGLAASLVGIAAAGLLQVTEGLLAEAAVVPACPQLQLLVQGIGQVADLECCHRTPCRIS